MNTLLTKVTDIQSNTLYLNCITHVFLNIQNLEQILLVDFKTQCNYFNQISITAIANIKREAVWNK